MTIDLNELEIALLLNEKVKADPGSAFCTVIKAAQAYLAEKRAAPAADDAVRKSASDNFDEMLKGDVWWTIIYSKAKHCDFN